MMTATRMAKRALPAKRAGRALEGSPADNLRLDWTMAIISCAIVFGLYIDGWAHNHGQVDDSFFTPWHALLYGAVGLSGLVLVVSHIRNVGQGFRWSTALPAGYTLSLIGFFAFGAGGLVDMFWHETFGFEEGIEALISPSHLFLALTGLLIMTGPIRALWRRGQRRQLEQPGTRHPVLYLHHVGLYLLQRLRAYRRRYDHSHWKAPVVAQSP